MLSTHQMPAEVGQIGNSCTSRDEPLCRCSISLSLEIHINQLTILIDRSPEIMLLAVDLYKDFVNVESVAVASVFSLKPSGV